MKYSDLISFNPIEDVIQLTTADDANRAKEYVKSYRKSKCAGFGEDRSMGLYFL